MGRIIRSTVTIAAAGVLASSLAACLGSGHAVSPAVITYSHGGPPVIALNRADPTASFAAWAGPRQIYVVAWGSGSCPHLPTTVHADAHNDLVVKTEQKSFGASSCTADLSPTTSIVNLPDGIDLTKPLRVDIDGSITTIDPR